MNRHYVKPPSEAPTRVCSDATHAELDLYDIGLGDGCLDYFCPTCQGYRESVNRVDWTVAEAKTVGELMGEHIRALGGLPSEGGPKTEGEL